MALLELLAESFQVLRRHERAHRSRPRHPAWFASKSPERFFCTVGCAKLFSRRVCCQASLTGMSQPIRASPRPLSVATAAPRHERHCRNGCSPLSLLRVILSSAKGPTSTVFHLQVSPGDNRAGCLQGGDGWDMARARLSE